MSADYRVGAVTPQIAQKVWPEIEHFIAGALKRTHLQQGYLPLDIFAMIQRGELLLWLAASDKDIAAAFVTKINEYPRCKTCNIFLLGGKGMRDWLPQVIAETEAYAKRMGCLLMEIGGREGWVRAAGYRLSGVALVKEL